METLLTMKTSVFLMPVQFQTQFYYVQYTKLKVVKYQLTPIYIYKCFVCWPTLAKSENPFNSIGEKINPQTDL